MSIGHGGSLQHPARDPGEFSCQTTYAWSQNGIIDCFFEGNNWVINTLAFTPLVGIQEDYLFSRSWFIYPDLSAEWIKKSYHLEQLADIKQTAVQLDNVWNSDIETFNASLNGTRTGFDTKEHIQKRVDLLRKGGFFAFWLNGRHFRQEIHNTVWSDILLRNTKLICEVAHRFGMAAIDHQDLNWIYYFGIENLIEALKRDPNCLQRSAADPLNLTLSYCSNSKNFHDSCCSYLQKFQQKTNIDGYQIDETQFLDKCCACDTCRRLFKQETGIEVFDVNTKDFAESSHNINRLKFEKWRRKSANEFLKNIVPALKRIKPSLIFSQYSAQHFSRQVANNNTLIGKLPRYSDYFGDEFHGDNVVNNWRAIFGRTKSRQGFSIAYNGNPTWILFRSMPLHEYVFGWSLCQASRVNLKLRTYDIDLSHKLNAWPYRMSKLNYYPAADTAVLFSETSRNLSLDDKHYHEEYQGWLQTLADINVQYNVIGEESLSLDKLSQYKCLLISNGEGLDKSQQAILQTYIKNGGVVIATRMSGVQQLLPQLGLEVDKTVQTIADCTVHFSSQKAFPISMQVNYYKVEPDINHWTPLGEMVAEDKAIPLIYKRNYGKGKMVYLPSNIVANNFESRLFTAANKTLGGAHSSKNKYPINYSTELRDVIRELMNANLEKPIVSFDMGGNNCLATFYESANIACLKKYCLHLLNIGGKKQYRKGEQISVDEKVDFPPFTSDIEITLNSETPLSHATFHRVLSDESIRLPLNKTKTGGYKLNVPKNSFDKYAVIYFLK